jgi:hypothetical protein
MADRSLSAGSRHTDALFGDTLDKNVRLFCLSSQLQMRHFSVQSYYNRFYNGYSLLFFDMDIQMGEAHLHTGGIKLRL